MSLALIFWVLMLLWLVLGGVRLWPRPAGDFGPFGNQLFVFILFLVLGWKVFGPIIQN